MLRTITLASVLSCTLAPAGAETLGATFDILRKGEPIGYHRVDVQRSGDNAEVRTEIRMKVKLGPIVLFRYEHDAEEVWRGGRLASLTSRTNNDGERTAVTATRLGETLMVDGSAYNGAAPEGAFPSSYWNKAIINAPALLNTQTGEIIEIETTQLGKTATPDGVSAEHYRLTGTVALNLWYEGERWVGSHFVIDGEELTYRLAPLAESETREASLARFDGQ